MNVATLLIAATLVGVAFGALAQYSHFCTMGAVADIVNMGNWQRMRAWLLAIAVAIAGTHALSLFAGFDSAMTFYTAPRLYWFAHLSGGLLFGIGMTLASGCGNKTLLRASAGNLKSWVVLLCLALTASASMRGILAPLRVQWLQHWFIDLPSAQTLPHLATQLGFGLPAAQAVIAGCLALALGLFALKDPWWRRDKALLIAAIGLGLLVVCGWWLTGCIGFVENPDTLEVEALATQSKRPESLTFIGPAASLLELGQRWSDTSLTLNWGAATVLGVMGGGFLAAFFTRSLRLESFHGGEDMLRHMGGGALMGFGGVTAVGCTIGQGLTGVSTLALGSIMTFAAIVAGCVLTLRFDEWRLNRTS